ncbi:MAG TPA: PAS domain-containing protein [Bryobacteraceae bacterium]|nr:PAS domain-containing protein [Bryobacteraceae bacterium]
MLWLLMLGIVVFLVIVVRRLLQRQNPLMDELFSRRIAIELVHDGVAWITLEGKLDYANPALARMLDATAEELMGRNWVEMLAEKDRARAENAYRQMLLSGTASFDASVGNSRSGAARRNVLLVSVHDHKTRLRGHHFIVSDRVLEAEPEARLSLAV